MRYLAYAALATLTACIPWARGLAVVDLPVDEIATRELESRDLDDVARTKSQTLESGRKELIKREAIQEGKAPLAVQEVETQLTGLALEDLRLIVLRQNLDLEVARYEPELARARVDSEVGRFDALIASRFRYREADTPRLDGPLVDFKSDDPTLDSSVVKLTELEQQQRKLGLDLDLRVPLPTGGMVRLGTGLAEKTITDPKRFAQYLAATRFSLSQPLLRNAGPTAALASIRIARTDLRISQLRTKLAALRVLARAEKAYWRLYLARRVLDVRAEQFRLARENLEVVQRRVSEGLTARVEIARSEVGVYARLEALVVAETDWRLRQRELKAFLASERFPIRGGRMIDVTAQPRLASLDLDADRLVDQALRERLDMIDFELRLVRDGIAIDLAENQVLPIVNLDFYYGITARGNSHGRSWESQFGFDHPDYGVGVSFAMPLGNVRRRANLQRAILTRAQRLSSRRARALSVRTEVRNAVDIIDRNWKRIVAARQFVLVAGVNYDAERRQFEQGLRTMREVFEALGSLGNAQLRELRAIVEYQVAQIDLAFATGTLLGYAGIDLSPLKIPMRPKRASSE